MIPRRKGKLLGNLGEAARQYGRTVAFEVRLANLVMALS
jgi:hypothetical protein